MNQRIRVLLVDDEPAVVESTEALLDDEFQVTSASCGEAALEALRGAVFDVVCTDYNMPGMTGAELLQRALAIAPHLGSVLVTGYREYTGRADRNQAHGYLLLLKPYDPRQLIDLVRRAGTSAQLKQKLTAINPSLARKPA